MTPKRHVKAFIFLLKYNSKKLKELNREKKTVKPKKRYYKKSGVVCKTILIQSFSASELRTDSKIKHVVLPGTSEHRNITEHFGTPKIPGTIRRKPGTPPKKPGTPQENPRSNMSELAHQELIQGPRYVANCWVPVFAERKQYPKFSSPTVTWTTFFQPRCRQQKEDC